MHDRWQSVPHYWNTESLATALKRIKWRMPMRARKYMWFIGWLSTLGVGVGVGTVIGQPNPPTENKGVDAKVVGTVDLGPDMPGYRLRTRVIVVEPGGVFGIHS